MKNNFIYIILIILFACGTPKQFIKNDNECSDDNIFGETLYKLDTTGIKNMTISMMFGQIYTMVTEGLVLVSVKRLY